MMVKSMFLVAIALIAVVLKYIGWVVLSYICNDIVLYSIITKML